MAFWATPVLKKPPHNRIGVCSSRSSRNGRTLNSPACPNHLFPRRFPVPLTSSPTPARLACRAALLPLSRKAEGLFVPTMRPASLFSCFPRGPFGPIHTVRNSRLSVVSLPAVCRSVAFGTGSLFPRSRPPPTWALLFREPLQQPPVPLFKKPDKRRFQQSLFFVPKSVTFRFFRCNGNHGARTKASVTKPGSRGCFGVAKRRYRLSRKGPRKWRGRNLSARRHHVPTKTTTENRQQASTCALQTSPTVPLIRPRPGTRKANVREIGVRLSPQMTARLRPSADPCSPSTSYHHAFAGFSDKEIVIANRAGPQARPPSERETNHDLPFGMPPTPQPARNQIPRIHDQQQKKNPTTRLSRWHPYPDFRLAALNNPNMTGVLHREPGLPLTSHSSCPKC